MAIVAAMVFFTKQSGPKPSSAPAGPSAVDLSSILLSVADLNTIMGASMAPANQAEQMLTSPGMVSNLSCLGAFEAIQAATYQGSGFTAVRGQGLHSTNPPHRVYQAAVEFPSTESAHAFVRRSAGEWKACAGQTVTVTEGNQTTPWNFGELNGAPPRIVQRRTEAGADGHVCQHVLSAVSRVVIDVHACGQTLANEGSQIADQMAVKVTP